MTAHVWLVWLWDLSWEKTFFGWFSEEDNGFSFGHPEPKELPGRCHVYLVPEDIYECGA